MITTPEFRNNGCKSLLETQDMIVIRRKDNGRGYIPLPSQVFFDKSLIGRRVGVFFRLEEQEGKNDGNDSKRV